MVDTGLSWTFDVAPQNRELVEWMRARNQRGQPVRFYGFDVPGSPGNPGVRRRLQTGVDVTLAYLARVDQAAESDLRTRLAPFLTLDPKTAVDGYAAMPAVNRNQVTAAIADLSALLERRGPTYRALSSPEAYEWARRTAAGARQTDNWLRRLPVGWKHTPGTRPAWFTDATNVRDRGMAENIEWILEREGPKAKILAFASRSHVTTSRMTDPGRADADTAIGLGQHLRARFGADLVTIGNVIGGGRWGCDKFVFPLTAPASHSVDGTFAAVGAPLYYLDIRSAPPAVRRWLDQEHPLGETPDPECLRAAASTSWCTSTVLPRRAKPGRPESLDQHSHEPRRRSPAMPIRPAKREPEHPRELIGRLRIAPEPEPHHQAFAPRHPDRRHMEVTVDPAKRDLFA